MKIHVLSFVLLILTAWTPFQVYQVSHHFNFWVLFGGLVSAIFLMRFVCWPVLKDEVKRKLMPATEHDLTWVALIPFFFLGLLTSIFSIFIDVIVRTF